MNKLVQYFFSLALMMATTGLSAGSHDCNHHAPSVYVKGAGTFVYPNPLSNGFNAIVTQINIKTKGHRIIHGTISLSSEEAGPIDPVTGTDFEATAIVDAVRVFPTHPDVVWVHGFQSGFVVFGSAIAPPNGLRVQITPQNGEFIGAITTWGRTNFLTVLENNNQPLPNFFNATEDDLITAVGGFSRILLTNGAKPGKVTIKTKGNNITIP